MMRRISKLFVVIGALSFCYFSYQLGQRVGRSAEDGVGLKNEPKRIGMLTGLDPEKAAYYKELHTNAWEGVLAAIERYNIRNFSIYLKEIEDKQYLFSYYEYIGDDYDADMRRIAADTTTQRWWRETDPCQIPLPEAAAKGEIWTPMEEVFHTD